MMEQIYIYEREWMAFVDQTEGCNLAKKMLDCRCDDCRPTGSPKKRRPEFYR